MSCKANRELHFDRQFGGKYAWFYELAVRQGKRSAIGERKKIRLKVLCDLTIFRKRERYKKKYKKNR